MGNLYFYLDFLNLLLHFLLCELVVRLVSCLCALHNLGQSFNYITIQQNIDHISQTKITEIFGRINLLQKILIFI